MGESPTSTRVEDPSRKWDIYERCLRWISVAVVFGVVIIAVLGGAGMNTATVSGSNGRLSVTVTFASVSRPGLATPFDIDITATNGSLPEQIVVAVTAKYLTLLDENGLSPDPVETNSNGEFELWTFKPTDRQMRLAISLDARLQPDRRRGESGTVRVTAEGHPPVSVSFHTRVAP